MSEVPFVAFNVLTVPEQARETLEQRFANRAGEVEKMPGFRHFELLRPVSGTDSYLVYTRWDTKEHFESWVKSMEFQRGHVQRGDDAPDETPAADQTAAPEQMTAAATGSEVWTFEAIQIKDVDPSRQD